MTKDGRYQPTPEQGDQRTEREAEGGDRDRRFGIAVEPNEASDGWRIIKVGQGSLAEEVGLEPGDVILSARDGEGNPLPISLADGREAVRDVVSSRQFTLQVSRAGDDPTVLTVTVTVQQGETATPRAEAERRDTPLQAGVDRVEERAPRRSTSPAPATGGYDRLVLTKASIRDQNEEEPVHNLVSHTLLAPKGWTVEGGVHWGGSSFNRVPTPVVAISAEDGTGAVMLPMLTFADVQPTRMGVQFDSRYARGVPREGQQFDGMPVKRVPQGDEGWKRWLEEHLATNPDAEDIQVGEPVEVPEMTRVLGQSVAPLERMIQQEVAQVRQRGEHMEGGVTVKALAFDITFTLDGKSFEAAALLSPMVVHKRSALGTEISWTPGPMVLLMAPEGKLDARAPTLMTILESIRPTQRWLRGVSQVHAKIAGIKNEMDRDTIETNRRMAQQTADAYSDINRIHRETSRQLSANQASTHENRVAASDDNSRRFTNAISDREHFSTTGNLDDAITLPSGYDRVYTNSDGDYILLDRSNNYDPRTDPDLSGEEWTPMVSHDD